jgi:LysM repeat protein
MSVKQGNAPTDYTVQNGDTLFEISKAYYSDVAISGIKLLKLNGNLTPETLKKVGQKIHIFLFNTCKNSGY